MKFSIVIPVYNVAPYLRECLDSVLAQIFVDWEAICVDDGSTDGGGMILDEYAKKDKRIRVLHRENAGVSAARNVGLDCARGEYVTFLDGDDVYLPDWLQVAADAITNTNPDLLRMRLTYWNGDSVANSERLQPVKSQLVEGAKAAHDWGWRTLMFEGWPVLLFVRNQREKLFAQVRFPVGMRNREDIIFCLRLALHLESACQIEYAGYLYRNRSGSQLHVAWPSSDVLRYVNECENVAEEWKKSLGSRVPNDFCKILSASLWEFLREWVLRRDRNVGKDERKRIAGRYLKMIHNGMLSRFDGVWTIGNLLFICFQSLTCLQATLFIRRIYILLRIGKWR